MSVAFIACKDPDGWKGRRRNKTKFPEVPHSFKECKFIPTLLPIKFLIKRQVISEGEWVPSIFKYLVRRGWKELP